MLSSNQLAGADAASGELHVRSSLAAPLSSQLLSCRSGCNQAGGGRRNPSKKVGKFWRHDLGPLDSWLSGQVDLCGS